MESDLLKRLAYLKEIVATEQKRLEIADNEDVINSIKSMIQHYRKEINLLEKKIKK